jgi:hypothetical protein
LTLKPPAVPKDSKPHDIEEYHSTIATITTLIESANQLVTAVGLEILLPQLVKAADQVENESCKH